MLTRHIELFAGLTGTIFNLILIPLILTKSSPKMGRYKYLLLAYTIVACYFAFSVSSGLYTWFFPRGGFLFVSTIDIFPRWFQQCQIINFVGCYVVTITIVDLCFVYRLSCLNEAGSCKSKLQYCVIAAFGVIFFLGVTIICGVFMAPSPENDVLFREEVYEALDIEIQKVGYIGGLLTINGELNMDIFSVVGVVGTFVSLSLVIIIICWHQIRQKLRIFRHTSNVNYSFHRKCYILLTLQTCIPILFNMAPAGVIIFLMVLKQPIGYVSHYCAMVLCFAQILDPLFTIIFITEYKRFVLKMIRSTFLKKRIGNPSGFTISSTGHISTQT